MSSRDRVTAWLEIDLDAHPIEGTLRPSGERASAFVGWLGLTAAISRLRLAGPEPAGEEQHDVGH